MMIRFLLFLYLIGFVLGVTPGTSAFCTERWVYPICCFFALGIHTMLYLLGFYLFKTEYLIQEDKIMEEAKRLSTTTPVTIQKEDSFKKADLEKSDKLLDRVSAQSDFMNIFVK